VASFAGGCLVLAVPELRTQRRKDAKTSRDLESRPRNSRIFAENRSGT